MNDFSVTINRIYQKSYKMHSMKQMLLFIHSQLNISKQGNFLSISCYCIIFKLKISDKNR